MSDIYSFSVNDIQGRPVNLDSYRGKVLLIVNTASQCGFTPQYQGLEKLYQDYRNKGLVVLAFPCNQFGGQEPAANAVIAEFCQSRYAVSFPLFEKIDVNGPNAHPLYQYLKTQAPGALGSTAIKWNFTKFLVGRDGKVVARFGSLLTPARLEKRVLGLL